MLAYTIHLAALSMGDALDYTSGAIAVLDALGLYGAGDAMLAVHNILATVQQMLLG